MNTDTTPIMPLEETDSELRIMLNHPDSHLHEWEKRAVTSALHHLEAGKRAQCSCDAFQKAIDSGWL